MHMKTMMMTAAVAAIMGVTGFVPFAYGEIVRPVPPSVIVESVKFRQRYPWNGLVDIDAKISCSDPATNLAVYVAAWDNVKDRALTVKTIWVDGDETKNPDLVTKGGTTRIVWDARADNPNEISSDVAISVQAYVRDMRYLVVDLSNGPDATEYPYSYRADPPEGGWTHADKTTNLVLRLIPAGTFIMGSPEDEIGHNDGEACVETQHKVTLTRPFLIGVFEVTQVQYDLVMGVNPSMYRGDARPVECVTYNMLRGADNGSHCPEDSLVDGNTFFGRIRKRTGLTFDLPTEAQWEYSCRAGAVTALNSGKNLTYWQKCDNMSEIGRYGQNRNDGKGGYSEHTTVGSYPSNAWGLYDMHGNIAEWCRDWLADDLGSSDVLDPVGPASNVASSFSAGYYRYTWDGKGRVIRGGCWNATRASWNRSALRSILTSSDYRSDPRGTPYFHSTGSNYNGPYGEIRYNAQVPDWGFRVVVIPDGK